MSSGASRLRTSWRSNRTKLHFLFDGMSFRPTRETRRALAPIAEAANGGPDERDPTESGNADRGE
jgi:hypothetical protein